jgi:predicted dehydrogenase
MKIGLVGFGRQAQQEYAPAIRKLGLEPHFVCDPSEQALASAASYGWTQQVRDLDHLDLDLSQPGLVIALALPHAQYHPVLQKLLTRGARTITMEKPPALTVKQFEETNRLIEKSSAEVVVMMKRRHYPSYQAIAERVRERSGALNYIQVSICRTFRPDPSDWRQRATEAGSSVLFDLGYHALDLLCWIAPAVATSRPVPGPRLSRSAVSQLRADVALPAGDNGSAIIFVDRQAPSPFEQVVIRLDDRMIVATPYRLSETFGQGRTSDVTFAKAALGSFTETVFAALFKSESTMLAPFRYASHRAAVGLAEAATSL